MEYYLIEKAAEMGISENVLFTGFLDEDDLDRILDEKNLQAVKRAVNIRKSFTGYIYKLAGDSALSNEPIVRSMEFSYPHQGYENVTDQFLLGEKVLVAPVLEQGKYQRTVKIPSGTWKNPEGDIFKGPAEITVKAPIDVLPYFEKMDQ